MEGYIFRPTKTVRQEVVRHKYFEDRLVEFKEEVESVIGGIDACPKCAAIAEFEYQSRIKEKSI